MDVSRTWTPCQATCRFGNSAAPKVPFRHPTGPALYLLRNMMHLPPTTLTYPPAPFRSLRPPRARAGAEQESGGEIQSIGATGRR
ncbi:hypothetical protein V5799_009392 [Amblyomma americanum]|uniref:Uncharacterized protein n=1 Tax=Amblyomma americanum TaxID=6943 RepID=A0AAQ4FBS2_AMBAM